MVDQGRSLAKDGDAPLSPSTSAPSSRRASKQLKLKGATSSTQLANTPRKFAGSSSNTGLQSPGALSGSAAAPAFFRTASSASTFQSDHAAALVAENKALRQQVVRLRLENERLKSTVVQLTEQYSQVRSAADTLDALSAPGQSGMFDLSGALEASLNVDEAADTVDAAELQRVPSSSSASSSSNMFHRKYELSGHTGAVYSVNFAYSGRLLASGSFDQSVRVWDLESSTSEVLCLKEHQLNVSDVSWSHGDALLLSSSFDGTAKLWDMQSGGKVVLSVDVPGFAQAVMFSPLSTDVFYVVSTEKKMLAFDARTPDGPTRVFENDAVVNCVHVFSNGQHLVTGDHNGMIKLWDAGTGSCFREMLNDPGHRPISYLTTTSKRRETFQFEYLAVNSFDNVLRVYDMKSSILSSSVATPRQRFPLVHELCGHKNKNWPIKSSFYCGHNAHQWSAVNRAADDDSGLGRVLAPEDSLLLATGSADEYAYVFDVGGGSGSASLLQRLEGHTDRVYATCFHPHRPVLASGSADFTVKIWGPRDNL